GAGPRGASARATAPPGTRAASGGSTPRARTRARAQATRQAAGHRAPRARPRTPRTLCSSARPRRPPPAGAAAAASAAGTRPTTAACTFRTAPRAPTARERCRAYPPPPTRR
ncbi:unnamed protein product, partial [Prorocentrum cordatum]